MPPFSVPLSGSITGFRSAIDDDAVDTRSEPGGILGGLTDSGKSETGGTELGRRATVDDLSALSGSILDGVRPRCVETRGNRAAAGLSALNGSIFDGF